MHQLGIRHSSLVILPTYPLFLATAQMSDGDILFSHVALESNDNLLIV